MCAGHDDPVVPSGRRLGDQVLGGHVQLDQRFGDEVDDDLALREQRGELVTDLERGADDRKWVGERVAERRGQGFRAPLLAFVEDDDADRTGHEGVVRLDREVAGTALDQRDVAGDEVGEVLWLAAAVRGARLLTRRQHEVDRLQWGRTSPLPEYSAVKKSTLGS